jgi:hypothetical protein
MQDVMQVPHMPTPVRDLKQRETEAVSKVHMSAAVNVGIAGTYVGLRRELISDMYG